MKYHAQFSSVKNRKVFSAEWLVCQVLWHNTDEYMQQLCMSTNMAMIYKMQSGFSTTCLLCGIQHA